VTLPYGMHELSLAMSTSGKTRGGCGGGETHRRSLESEQRVPSCLYPLSMTKESPAPFNSRTGGRGISPVGNNASLSPIA